MLRYFEASLKTDEEAGAGLLNLRGKGAEQREYI
jgi:hypothetical protein